MSKNQESHDIHDEDLQKIFGQQEKPEIPKELDQRILAAAAHDLEKQQIAEISRKNSSRIWQQGLAVAALLVLSVSLVPLLNRQEMPNMPMSEAEIDVVQDAAIESLSVPLAVPETAQSLGESAKPTAKRAAENAPAPAVPMFESAGNNNRVIREKALMQSAPVTTDLSASDEAVEEEAVLEKDSADPAYRQNPLDWLLFIKSLEKAGDKEQAAKEKQLFEKTFPDFRKP